MALDATRLEDLQRIVARAQAVHGRIDVLINNAGVMPLSPLSPLAALKVAEWNRTLDVNVRGVLHGIAAVLPIMQAQGGGHVVNIASIGAHAVSPTAAVYCASKFAVRAISDGLRQETDAIRVTLVSPGVVESELSDHITDETARAAMREFRRVALAPQAVAQAIAYAIAQPEGVDVSEIIVRPTASPQLSAHVCSFTWMAPGHEAPGIAAPLALTPHSAGEKGRKAGRSYVLGQCARSLLSVGMMIQRLWNMRCSCIEGGVYVRPDTMRRPLASVHASFR